ncbi:MAG: PHP domain-containing protein, partial [Verrucomicrobiota bacterium]|nr:PHP domain-containing protein [Verrucomicrobiota bacterium]
MFTELHARSSFSFLRGASQPEDLVRRAAELGYQTIALLDHMGVQGSARAHFTAQQLGLRSLVGATAELPNPQSQIAHLEIPLLVKNRTGYQNLCRLLTDLHCVNNTSSSTTSPLQGTKSGAEIPFPPAFCSQTKGLIALLTPESLPDLTKANLLETAIWLRDTFGPENLYLTLTRHHIRGEERRNRLLIDLAGHLKLPLLASNAPLFARRRDRLLADAFTCLRHHTTLDQAGTLLEANPERHLKSPSQVTALFHDHPKALHNTQLLADRLEFTLTNLGYRFPSYHENGHPLSPGKEAGLLRELTFRGARQRYGKVGSRIRRQLEHELALIIRLGFSGYSLIVWELV